MRAFVSNLISLLLLAGMAGTATAQTSLRFTGNAIPDQDRVTIRIDPHVPADVGLDFTLEFWMKANAADNPSGSLGTATCNPSSSENWIVGRIIIDRAIFNHDRHGEYGVAIFRSGNTATLAFGILKLLPNRPGLGLCGSRNVADGLWHHVAITRDGGTGLVQIWVDGTIDVSGTGPAGDISYENGVPSDAPAGSLQRDNFLGFGAEKFDADANRYPSYRGLLDDVRISNVVRYTSSFPRPTAPHPRDAGTVALYRFDEASGTAIVDENSNQSPGVLRPPASRSTDTPFGGGTPSAGTLQFSSPTYSVNEGVVGGAQAITVSRTGGSSGAASVSFQVMQGTATANADYAAPPGSTLSWSDGDGANKAFDIPIINDQSPESNETVDLALSAPSGATLGSPAAAVLTILDNDTTMVPGTLQFSAATFSTTESAGSVLLTVTRSGGSDGNVAVNYSSASGTATAGADFAATFGLLSWPGGDSTSRTISVPIVDDEAVESTETFSISLSAPTGGATLGTQTTGTVTITDNDSAPPPPSGSLRFSAASQQIAESGGSITFSVSRVNGSAGAITVAYASSDGTAAAPSDYQGVTGTLSWANGDTANKSVTVTVNTDTLIEGNETFSIALSAPTGGAMLSSPSQITVTITDNDSVPPPPPGNGDGGGGGGGSAELATLLALLLGLRRGQRCALRGKLEG